MQWTIKVFALMLLIGSLSAGSSAQMLDTLAIHGFGGWAYGRTDNVNRYLAGNEQGITIPSTSH